MAGLRGQWLACSREARLVLLIAAVQLVLALPLLAAVAGVEKGPLAPPGIPWWVLLVLFAGAEMSVFVLRMRRELHTVSLSEIPLVLGLFFASPAALLVSRVGSVLALAAVRKQTLLKVAFNATVVVGEVAVALVVFHTVPGSSTGSLTFHGWVAMYAAVVAAAVFVAVSITTVVSVYEGAPTRRDFVSVILSGPAMSVLVATVGLTGVHALDANVWSAAPLLVSVGLLLAGYRVYARLSDRHLALDRIYQFSHVVTSTPETDEVLRNVLDQATELLRSESAEVLFATPGQLRLRVQVSPAGVLERLEEPVEAGDWVWRKVMGGSPVLLGRSGVKQDAKMRTWLDQHRRRDAVVVPLQGEAGIVGALVVSGRRANIRAFDSGDVQLLETVANHASIALQNGRLVDQLRHEALHDGLTGLPNRVLLQRRLAESLRWDTVVDAGADAMAEPAVAVMVMDLNGFKDVNDTLGHQNGDVLLQEVAVRMRTAVPDDVLVARLGGDEFAVLIPEVTSERRVRMVAELILRALEQPITVEGIHVQVGASIGAAMSPNHGADGPTLLKRADVAMYAAKSDGGGLRVYDPALDTTNPHRLALVGALRQAINDDQLVLEMQPKVRLGDDVIVGVEALVRWDHPRRGRLSPDEFVSLAERSGLIRPLTLWVLRQALTACQQWRAAGHDLSIAVNMSERSLVDPNFAAEVAAELAARGLPGRALTLELTESTIMSDPARTLALLTELHAMGVRLSIDDFGTGYSSLSRLKRLPVHEVKIDRSFVTDMRHDLDNAVIVRSIIDLADNLALTVVAEGIEDAETCAELGAMGCHEGQGYFVGRPMPTQRLLDWLGVRGGAREPGVPVPRASEPVADALTAVAP